MFSGFQKRYGLSDRGLRNTLFGILYTVLTNLVVMAGVGSLLLVMKGFLDHLTQGRLLPRLLPYLGGLLVFVLLLFATTWLQYTYTYGAVYGETTSQRLGLAERLRKLPLSFFGRRDLADLTDTMLKDVATMEHANSHVLAELYGAVISSLLVFLALLGFDWRLDLAAFWSVPAAFCLLFAARGHVTSLSRDTRAGQIKVSDRIQETLDCVREIRATNQEDRYLEGLYATIDQTERTTARGELINGLVVNSAMIVLRMGLATTLLTAAGLIAGGQIDFMTMFLFLLMVSRIYSPFDQAMTLVSELFLSQAAAERIGAVMDEPAARGVVAFEPAGHDVAFDHVTFSYGQGPKVLDDVSFTARQGQVTALVGPSGSGKSTCARLAARFWDVSSGRVTVGGVDVSWVDPESLLKEYAVVFQEVTLFNDTVMGNIRLGRKGASDSEVLAAARAANCDGFVDRLPQGYRTMIGENGSRLSGGERQRISIARALLKDAPIVLLDEATACLDVENETEVQGALSRLLADKTVIVIAHRMRTVEKADKVVVLREGRVVEEGVPADLLAAGGEFARMVGLQQESAGWTL